MTTQITHRHIARKKARAWQAGAIALLAGAGALAALPIQKLLAPALAPIGTEPVVIKQPEGRAPVDPSLLLAAATTLKSATGWKPPESIDVPPVMPDELVVGGEPTPAPVASGEWFYIGSIITPRTRRAMIKVDANQHLMAVGETIAETKVVSIDPEAITIERAGVQTQLALQTRTSSWPTDGPKRPVAFRGPATAMAPPGMPPQQAPGMKRANVPQTFDQARAAALAEAARRAQAPVNPPTMAAMPKGPVGQEELRKALSDENLSVEDRLRYLEQLGISPGMSTEKSLSVLNASGIQVNDSLVNALKHNQEIKRPENPPPSELSAEEIRSKVIETMLTPEERSKLDDMSKEDQNRLLDERSKVFGERQKSK